MEDIVAKQESFMGTNLSTEAITTLCDKSVYDESQARNGNAFKLRRPLGEREALIVATPDEQDESLPPAISIVEIGDDGAHEVIDPLLPSSTPEGVYDDEKESIIKRFLSAQKSDSHKNVPAPKNHVEHVHPKTGRTWPTPKPSLKQAPKRKAPAHTWKPAS